MKNYKTWDKMFLLGMLAMVLAFGLVVTGCDNGNGNGNGGSDLMELIPISGVTGEQVYTLNYAGDKPSFVEYNGNVPSITAKLTDPAGDEADKTLDGSIGSI